MYKTLKLILLFVSLVTLVIRFIYGTKYEMKNGAFKISSTGITLTLIIVITFIVYVILNSITTDKKNE
jgi:hypothetical protein